MTISKEIKNIKAEKGIKCSEIISSVKSGNIFFYVFFSTYMQNYYLYENGTLKKINRTVGDSVRESIPEYVKTYDLDSNDYIEIENTFIKKCSKGEL